MTRRRSAVHAHALVGVKGIVMAIDLRKNAAGLSAEERALLMDVKRLESCLQGHCFTALGFLRRAATSAGIKLALLGAGASARVELSADGWRLSEEAVSLSTMPLERSELSIFEKLAASHKSDYASQRARTALRRRPKEASDQDEADGDGLGEVSPVLEQFRERTTFQMQGL